MKLSVKRLLALSAIAGLGLNSAACNTVPIATGCSTLAEGILGEPVEHPEIGDSGDELLDWQTLGTAYAGALTTANGRSAAGLRVIQGCERRDAEVQRARASWNPFD